MRTAWCFPDLEGPQVHLVVASFRSAAGAGLTRRTLTAWCGADGRKLAALMRLAGREAVVSLDLDDPTTNFCAACVELADADARTV